MAWIESHQSLSKHRKTLRAVAMLKSDRHKLLGHLHELWWWGIDNADYQGNLGNVSATEIAEAAGWPVREADRFVEALLRAGGDDKPGFLERLADGAYVLHDWYQFAGKLNDRRDANRERMQRARAGNDPQNDPPTNGARAQHVNGTTDARAAQRAEMCGATGPTGPDQPDRTNNSVSEETASEPVEASPGDDRVDDLYRHYKARIQPKSRLCPRKKIAARLKRFTADELKAGIDHFADDPWWMSHNSDKGAEWFFESDTRAEQFLLMQPRQPTNVVPMNARTTPAPRLPVDRTGVAN